MVYVAWKEGERGKCKCRCVSDFQEGGWEGGTDIQVKRAVAAVMQGRLYMSSAMAAWETYSPKAANTTQQL